VLEAALEVIEEAVQAHAAQQGKAVNQGQVAAAAAAAPVVSQ